VVAGAPARESQPQGDGTLDLVQTQANFAKSRPASPRPQPHRAPL